MRTVWIWSAVLMVAVGGCVGPRGHAVSRAPESSVELPGGARLIYSSDRGRSDEEERALAVHARALYCAHAAGWTCLARGTGRVSIGLRPDVDCVVSVDGEKQRIDDSRITTRASASLYCLNGRPSIWQEDFYRPGDAAPTDGPGETTTNPRSLDGANPIPPVPED